jgi:uncharacterized membrane protein YphA (DoxX/SURF4 family)
MRESNKSRIRLIAYWIITVLVAAEFLIGGVMDIFKLPPYNAVASHLGYPAYFSIIMGTWKVLGSVAIIVPRFVRLKEWAYAGMFFNVTGALASHIFANDAIVVFIAPIIFACLVVASWALRPASRKMA